MVKTRYKVHLSDVSVSEVFSSIGEAIEFVEGYAISCLTDEGDGMGIAEPGKVTIEPC